MLVCLLLTLKLLSCTQFRRKSIALRSCYVCEIVKVKKQCHKVLNEAVITAGFLLEFVFICNTFNVTFMRGGRKFFWLLADRIKI